MVRNIGMLILLFSFVGCSGEPGNDSGSGDNKQSASNTPGNKTEPANRGSGDKPGGRVDGVFTSGKNMQDMNSLRQVALAMHNFHVAYRVFPTATKSSRIKRHEKLSWRVSLLPFAELGGEYDKFDREQAWDSDKNKAQVNGPGKDYYTLSNGNLICAIKHKVQPSGLRDIVDGSSNTVMLIENPNAQGDQWTQPVDLTPEEAVKIVKSLKKGEFVLGAFYDGSGFKIYSTEGRDIPDSDIAAMFGYKDATPLNDELLRPGK